MSIINDLDHEILRFFLLLYEHNDDGGILETLLKKIPFGRHPLYYVEFIENPHVRSFLRLKYGDLINIRKLLYDFKKISTNPDLMKGSFLISRLSDSIYLDFELYQKEFIKLSNEFIKSYPNFWDLSPYYKFEKMVEFLYFTKGFHGNIEDYYNDKNSFLTEVFNLKKGIPISLSVLMILFYESLSKLYESQYLRKLDFHIYGINLPAHFILYFESASFKTYFDPFNFGNKVTYEDCCKFLNAYGFPVNMNYFLPASPTTILKRMLKNLENYYSNLPESKKEMTVKQMIKILDNFQVEA